MKRMTPRLGLGLYNYYQDKREEMLAEEEEKADGDAGRRYEEKREE